MARCLARRDQQLGDVHRQLEGNAHLAAARLGFDEREGLVERGVELVQLLLAALVARRREEGVESHPRLHPPGAERSADDLESGRAAAASDLERHLTMPHTAGEALCPQADQLGALLVDEVGKLAQPFGHLAAQRRCGALGDGLAIGALQGAHRFALGGEPEQQRHHLLGVLGRLPVQLDVADAVLVLERPKGRQQLRGAAIG